VYVSRQNADRDIVAETAVTVKQPTVTSARAAGSAVTTVLYKDSTASRPPPRSGEHRAAWAGGAAGDPRGARLHQPAREPVGLQKAYRGIFRAELSEA